MESVRELDGQGQSYIKRAVLCRTPRRMEGPFIILLFLDGLIMYTKNHADTWTVLPMLDQLGHVTFCDVILIDYSIIAVGVGVNMMSWNIAVKPISYPQYTMGLMVKRPRFAKNSMTLFLGTSP